jgi:hypothetical protein
MSSVLALALVAVAQAQDSQGLWTHQDRQPGRMTPPPSEGGGFPVDVRFGYALELRHMPDIGLVHAHGGSLTFAPAIDEHFAIELSFAFLATVSGELVQLFPRPAVGVEIMTNDRSVVLAAGALVTFAGHGEHVREEDDEIRWRAGIGLALGGTVTFAPWDVFTASAFGLYADARYQVAFTERGFEHGPLVSAGLTFVDRQRVDR